eukprot:3084047-Ditylum_brightwellii.AAC.1
MQIQNIAPAMGIETKIRVTKIKEDGTKDESNKVFDDAFAYKALMAGNTVFVEEITLLQCTATQIGANLGILVVVNQPPYGYLEL